MKRLLPFLFLVALTAQAQLQLQIVGGVTNLLQKAGDTSTGPQLTTSSTTNAPSATEFVTAQWVRGLLNNGFFEYASTNIISGTNADSPNQFLYSFHMGHVPDSATRVWTSAFLTNGGYVGSVSTTNTFQSIAGQILVNAYIGLSSGGGDALSLKPEIYLSTDRSNWYGDFDCAAQAITPGATQGYSFVISFPAQTATNTAGFYIERRLKVVSKGGSPTMYFLVGTNAISGTNSASHMAINASPVQGGTFVGSFIGDGGGLTNLTVSGGSSNITDSGYVAVIRNVNVSTNLAVVGNITNFGTLDFRTASSSARGQIWYDGNNDILQIKSIHYMNFSAVNTPISFNQTLSATGGIILPSTTAYIKWQGLTASNPPTSGAGTAFVFGATNASGTAEIFTMDGAGVIKQISEHAMDAPDQLLDDDDEAPNISKEILIYTGKVRWINRSREARQFEMVTKLSLNSLAYYQFTTGKTSTQWTNSNSYGFYTNAIAYLDPLTAAKKQIVMVESFSEYNTRMGLTNGNGLVKLNWSTVQAQIQATYATGYTNSLIAYTNAFSVYTNCLATATDTNTCVSPVLPSYAPPPVQPVPSWLQKRGVN